MSYESGKLDAIDRQLMDAGAPPKVSEWTEIGEAEITYTISGKAQVRIKRKYDQLRRMVFLLLMLAFVALAWQGWKVYDRTEQQTLAHDGEPIKSTGVDSEQTASSAENNAGLKPEQAKINKKSEQQHQDLEDTKQAAMKPFVRQPVGMIRPQSAPAATNSSALLNPADTQFQNPLSPKTTLPPTTTPPQSTLASASSAATATTVAPPIKQVEPPSTNGEIQPMDQRGAKP